MMEFKDKRKKTGAIINKVANMIVFASLLVTGSVVIFTDFISGAIILIVMALYMLFIKMDNIENMLKGR